MKSLFFFTVIFSSVIFLSKSLGNGGAVGNSGVFAVCESDPKLYAADFLISRDLDLGEDRDLPLDTQLQTIYQELKRLNELWTDDLKDFLETRFQQVRGRKYQWLRSTKLATMWNPGLDELLPSNCKEKHQAFYYFPPEKNFTQIYYKYDPDLIPKVRQQPGGDLQVSYLLIHEWLWNHFDSTDILYSARFNRLLHSKKLLTLNEQDYKLLKAELARKPPQR
ncbi:MAG: hypothetical protein AB7O96_20085 [Pseudobdellovibrionaceae bacterium]